MKSSGTKLPHNEKYQLDANIYKSIPDFNYLNLAVLGGNASHKRASEDLGLAFMQLFYQTRDRP